MLYPVYGVDNVHLAIGIAQGMMAKKTEGAGNELKVTVEAGLGRVGTIENDERIFNKAALGLNQPGIEVEFAGGSVAVKDDQKSYVWLKTDGETLVATDWNADPNLVAPELGPDPHKGRFIDGLQEGQLRYKEAASILIAEVTAAAGVITVINNKVRNLIQSVK